MSPPIPGTRTLRGLARCLCLGLACLGWTPTLRALDPTRPLSLQAQHTWRSEDGLLQDSVTALLESRDGFLWIGTEGGLTRFDGASFEHHSRINLPAFARNAVQCLAEAAEGGLWIGTSEPGLYLLRRGTLRAFGAAEGLPDQPIRRLLRDRSGVLWAAPAQGPLLRHDGARFHAVPSEATQLRIRALTEGPDGTIWVGTAGTGLWRVQGDRLTLAALTDAEITRLEVGDGEDLWVGTRTRGLLLWREGRLEAPTWLRSLPTGAISVLLKDRKGALWIGFEQGGLFRRTPVGALEAVPGKAAWTPLDLLEDSSGALWMGSRNRGLTVLYPVPFQPLPLAGGPPDEPLTMVCQDAAGTVWCLLGDQTLGVVRRDHIERSPLRTGSAPMTALWPRRGGGLWVGTRGGELYLLDQGRMRRLAPGDASQPDAIQFLYEDPAGVLWVGFTRRGLVRIASGEAPIHYPALQGLQAAAGGGTHPLYLGSRTQGLGVLEGGQVRWLAQPGSPGSSGVQSLHLDREGTLWLGTREGLLRSGEGRIEPVPDLAGTLRLPIHALLEDGQGQLWVGTSQGACRVSRTHLLATSPPREDSAVVVYDHHDGMPSREIPAGFPPSAWFSREGDLYFSTSRGLCRLERGAGMPAGPPLRLHILKTEGDETVLPEQLPVQVPAGTHHFEVYYTATSLTRADKVRFRYRLEGWETPWTEAGDRRVAAYSNLPPGTYRFVLQAWRVDEEGPPQERSLEVRVHPFFYQRPLFWFACAGLALAFGGWLLRLRLQQDEARTAVLAERNRMAREIHDHLAQGFTGVLLQLEAAEARLGRLEGDPGPVLTRLNHARDLAASSLQEARRSVMALRPRKAEGEDLLGALQALADRLLVGTDIQVELSQTGKPRPLQGQVEEELLRMAQELITNALRHGHARWVRAALDFEGRRVHLSIEDDGRGFDPTVQAPGYGLQSIREGLKRLGGRLEIDSRPGFGSRITLTLPLRRWRP